jgi:hypothetical protein
MNGVGDDAGPGGAAFQRVRELALALPGVEEGTSYGTPAFRVKGKFFVRLKEDNESMVLKTDFFERDHLLESDPGVFYTTDHYRGYPSVLVRFARVDEAQLRALLTDAWRRLAPARVVREFDAAPGR